MQVNETAIFYIQKHAYKQKSPKCIDQVAISANIKIKYNLYH